MSKRFQAVVLGLLVLAVVGGCASSRTAARRPVVAPVPPLAVPTAIDESLQARALGELSAARASGSAELRSQAIEAYVLGVGPAGAKQTVLAGLNDPSVMVRFAAAVAIGQMQIAEALPELRGRLSDPSPHVQAAVRYAMHKLGDRTHTQDLVALSMHPDANVRANVAFVLGLLGESSAIRILRPMQADPSANVRLEVAGAMWRLRSDDGLEALAQFSISQFGDDQILALLAMTGPQDARAMSLIRGRLTDDYEEVRLAAARAMGELGSDRGYAVATEQVSSGDPRRRVLAAMALGAIGRADAQDDLAPLLNDPQAEVRLAAATALLRIGHGGGASAVSPGSASAR
jgi:HEAT repeat protein